MKKFLSVALALAMTLSLVVVGASAKSFTDSSKVNYKEAVDVISACKVIDGYTDGSFAPTNTLTRGAAAKIICNMMLGPTTASALGVSTAPFKDVSVSNVFAGYIAYCSSKGIISGYADKTFRPAGTVTGYQFLKMLLGALGYDSTIEGFTGSNWEVNVAKLASNLGLYDGNDSFVGTKALTREEACLYAYNTLQSNVVEYENKGTTITINGVTIAQGASKASTVARTTGTDYTGVPETTTGTLQFCEQYFKSLKQNSAATVDAFGRPSTTWVYGTTTIGTYADAPVATFKGYTSASKVASALSGYLLTAARKVNNTDTAAVDAGSILSANTNAKADFTVSAGTTIATAISNLTNTGKVVEIYANSSNVITNIVEVTYTVATVTSVTAASSKTTYVLTNLANGGSVTGIDYSADSSSEDTISLAGTVAKGDYVTYVKPTNSSVVYVYPTTTVAGVQTAKSVSDETITVGGTTYSVATGATTDGSTAVAMTSFNNSSKSANYYLDQFGNVVATTSTAAYSDYAYIAGTYGTVTSSVNGAVPSAQVKVVLADGSVKTCDVKLTELTAAKSNCVYGGASYDAAIGDYIIDGTNICVYKTGSSDAAAVNTEIGRLAKTVVGYSISNNVISMNTLDTASGAMTADSAYVDTTVDGLTNGVTSLTGSSSDTALFNNSTVFVVYNPDKGTAAVYTGRDSLPSTTLNGAKVVMTALGTTTGLAKVAFISTNSLVTDTASYVYIDATAYTESLNNGTTTYTYTGTKADGTTITLTKSSMLGSGVAADSGLYLYNTDNTIGSQVCATTTTTPVDFYVYDATLTLSNNILNAGDAYYNVTSNTKIVYINSSLSEVNGNGGYVVLASKNGAATSDVAAIYVTVD